MQPEFKQIRQSPLRFALAALCCATYAAFLFVLAAVAGRDPLAPLLDVRFSAIGVCLNFAVCLGAAAWFGAWRKRRHDAATQARKST